MEKQSLVERPKLLRAFMDMEYSLDSQEIIADYIAQKKTSNDKEEAAKRIIALMEHLSEQEVIENLNQ